MAKGIMYVCKECGNKSIHELGKCFNCGATGSFEKQIETKKLSESKIKKTSVEQLSKIGTVLKVKKQEEIKEKEEFFPLKDKELLRVMTQGISVGGVYLLAGNPGAGKSTLMAQIIAEMKDLGLRVAYFSGEEHEGQVLNRFKRLNIDNCDVYYVRNLEDIFATIEANKYEFVVLDSVQTTYTTTCEGIAGKSAQVTAVSEMFTEFCKERKITSFLIGHYTKGGDVAGPQYLAHIVDASLQLDGDKYQMYKFLRASKNRFSQNDDVGIFEMTTEGLKGVSNMRERVLQSFTKRAGNVLAIGIDDGRPCLITIEVLITKSSYKFPQRNVIGYDKDRVDLIVAIMEKYLGINLQENDIFLNIPGEQSFKKDLGLDLAVVAAIYSAVTGKIFSEQVFFGELTLMGKIRTATFEQRRRKEGKEFKIYTATKELDDIDEMFRGKQSKNTYAPSMFKSKEATLRSKRELEREEQEMDKMLDIK